MLPAPALLLFAVVKLYLLHAVHQFNNIALVAAAVVKLLVVKGAAAF